MTTFKTTKGVRKIFFNYLMLLLIFTFFSACYEDPLLMPSPHKKPHPVFPVHPSAGELEVNVATTDGDGVFRVRVRGVEEKEVPANGQVSFHLRKGTYEVELLGLEGGYVVIGDNPQIVEMMPKRKVSISFQVERHQAEEQIIFSSNRTGFWEIFAMDTDGSNVRQLTNFESAVNYPIDPEISPDGHQILFNISGSIYIMDIDGSNVQQLTFHTDPDMFSRDFFQSWSADGSQIVFSRIEDIYEIIYIMNADGTNLQEVASGLEIIMPDLSPDGSKVLFVRDFGISPEGAKIYIVNSDGSNEELFIDHGLYNYHPKWSPDGSQVLFSSHQLYIANADGTGIEQITFDVNPKYDPNWSPDGSQIVYRSVINGVSDIFSMNVDGSNIKNLTNNSGQDSYPSWGPVPSGADLP